MGDEVMTIRGTVEGKETVQALAGGLLVEAKLESTTEVSPPPPSPDIPWNLNLRSDSSDRSIDHARVRNGISTFSRVRARPRVALVPKPCQLWRDSGEWERLEPIPFSRPKFVEILSSPPTNPRAFSFSPKERLSWA